MMGKNLVETIMGGFVLVVAAIFLSFAYLSANLQPTGGYPIKAAFASVDGLTPGSDVRIGGVKVGTVTQQSIDTKDFRAIVTMNVQPDVKLPSDSKASIASVGLLGGKYIKLEPGHAATMLKPGGEITNTEGAVVLEELLGRIIFLATQDQGTAQGGQGGGQGDGRGGAGAQPGGGGAPSLSAPGANPPGATPSPGAQPDGGQPK
jgi:phospholipid/cholesterol/gamma-HCH transport system substrate-binding protein